MYLHSYMYINCNRVITHLESPNQYKSLSCVPYIRPHVHLNQYESFSHVPRIRPHIDPSSNDFYTLRIPCAGIAQRQYYRSTLRQKTTNSLGTIHFHTLTSVYFSIYLRRLKWSHTIKGVLWYNKYQHETFIRFTLNI